MERVSIGAVVISVVGGNRENGGTLAGKTKAPAKTSRQMRRSAPSHANAKRCCRDNAFAPHCNRLHTLCSQQQPLSSISIYQCTSNTPHPTTTPFAPQPPAGPLALLVKMRRANKLQMNFAHMPGACGVAVSPDGRFALTSGVDCTVRVHDIRAGPPEPWWIASRSGEPEPPDLPASDLHDKPINDVALNPDASTFATACDDGFVRIFSASITAPGPAQPLTADSDLIQACARFGGPVRALSFSPTGAFLAAAGDEPGVIKIIMTAQPSNVNVLRATSKDLGLQPIVALAFDPKSDFVAAVAGDGSATVWGIDSGACASALAINHRHASSVAWSPDGSLLLVGTDKGPVLVRRDTWSFDRLLQDESGGDDYDEDELEDLGKIKGSIVDKGQNKDKNNDEKSHRDHDSVEKNSATSSSISAIAWSKNGRYALTCREDNSVRLWHVAERKVLAQWRTDEVIQAIRWHPTLNVFMAVDRIGQWAVVAEVVPSHMPTPYEVVSCEKELPLPIIPEVSPEKMPMSGDDSDSGTSSGSNNEGDSDDEEDLQVRRRSSAKKRKELRRKDLTQKIGNPSKNGAKIPTQGDQGIRQRKETNENGNSGDDSDDDVHGTIGGSDDENGEHPRPELNFNASDLDADEEEDVGELRRQRELARRRAEMMNSDEDEDEYERRRRRRERRKKRRESNSCYEKISAIPAAQLSFMPSSTPLQDKVVTKKRILCWTLSAAIVSYDESTHDTVEIEFADATRRNIGIKDHFGFTLGCISDTGVMLASPLGKAQNSLVMFRPFSSWSNQSEWSQFLAHDESAIAIALGVRFAAVAVSTPRNIVRIFSLSGIQTDVFGVPGRVVTMSASKDRLALVYAASPYTPELRYQYLEVASSGEVLKTLSSDSLILSPNSSLEWLGFTRDSCELVSYDSTGCIWMLALARGGMRWLPMLNNAAKTAECDWFWLAAVTSESAIGAPCLSNERHPPATPRPALRTVPLLAPVIVQVSKSGQVTLEERLFRTRMKLTRSIAAKAAAEELFDSDDDELDEAVDAAGAMELETDKCILALLETACRQEQSLRAFDLATRLNCLVSFKFAVDLANHYKRSAVAGRIEELANRKLAAAAAEEEEKRADLGAASRGYESVAAPVPALVPVGGVAPARECDGGSSGSDAEEYGEKGAGSGRDDGVNYDSDDEDDEEKGSPVSIEPAKNKVASGECSRKRFTFPPPPFAKSKGKANSRVKAKIREASASNSRADLTGVSDDEEEESTPRLARPPSVGKAVGHATAPKKPMVPSSSDHSVAERATSAAVSAPSVRKRTGGHVGNRFQKRTKKLQ
jgi:WD40 repeat protein